MPGHMRTSTETVERYSGNRVKIVDARMLKCTTTTTENQSTSGGYAVPAT